MADLLPYVADQPLVDHHCHGVLRRDADVSTLESMLSEGDSWPGGSVFDSQAGLAFRRLCPPVLGLPPHAELGDYVARRAELGATEVSKRFLVAAGASVLCPCREAAPRHALPRKNVTRPCRQAVRWPSP